MINSWLLYRRHASQLTRPTREQLDLAKFTASISEALVQQNKLPPVIARKRGRPSAATSTSYTSTSDDEEKPKKRSVVLPVGSAVRFDNVGHFPIHSEPKQRCKACSSYVRMKCVKCRVHLCITKAKNCFIDYHTL